MIGFNPLTAQDSREALSRHLETEIVTVLGNSAPEHTDDIAQAIAAYCATWQDEFSLSSEYLAMLVSRALRAAGEEEAALHFSGGSNSPLAEVLFRFRHCSPALWSLFASRLIRPSRWLVNNGRLIWVLDISRIRSDADLDLKLAFYQAIRAVLLAIAEIWDPTAGVGILGLRSIRSCGYSLQEIQSLCSNLFERIKAQRGWVSIPQVLNLDGMD